MQLQNPFPLAVRVLFLGVWECWLCHENGTRSGGLELHHIFGRISASALNAAVLCKRCHSHIGHNREEHQKLLRRTIHFLLKQGYKLLPVDNDFLERVKNELRDFTF